MGSKGLNKAQTSKYKKNEKLIKQLSVRELTRFIKFAMAKLHDMAKHQHNIWVKVLTTVNNLFEMEYFPCD
jgi:hypothetical protein